MRIHKIAHVISLIQERLNFPPQSLFEKCSTLFADIVRKIIDMLKGGSFSNEFFKTGSNVHLH